MRFADEDGSVRYYATYSAYDGKMVLPQILETTDFLHFKISTLNGPEGSRQGFRLFPRKINGMYAMLLCQDGENMYLMYSDMIHFWYTKQLLMKPATMGLRGGGNFARRLRPTMAAAVTHGVGPMRKYSVIVGALIEPGRPEPGDWPLERTALGSQRKRARRLRAECRLQLRSLGAQRRSDRPLCHGGLRHNLRHCAAGGFARQDQRKLNFHGHTPRSVAVWATRSRAT